MACTRWPSISTRVSFLKWKGSWAVRKRQCLSSNEYVFKDPQHRWYKDGMSKEELQKLEQFYRQRYGGKEVK